MAVCVPGAYQVLDYILFIPISILLLFQLLNHVVTKSAWMFVIQMYKPHPKGPAEERKGMALLLPLRLRLILDLNLGFRIYKSIPCAFTRQSFPTFTHPQT